MIFILHIQLYRSNIGKYLKISPLPQEFNPYCVTVYANDLKNIITQLPSPFILIGDFNTHNSLGFQNTNIRGKHVEKVLKNDNLIPLNNN